MGGAEIDELLPSGFLRRYEGTHGDLVEVVIEPGDRVRFRVEINSETMVSLRMRPDQARHLGNLLLAAAAAPTVPMDGAS